MVTVIGDDVIPAGTTKSTDISAYGETLNISILNYPKTFWTSSGVAMRTCERVSHLSA